LFYLAKALLKLQSFTGIIPNIVGKGSNAQFITEMLFRMRRETATDEPMITPEFDSMIIIDRSVDMVTPLLTQLTYEGLIDEVFGIQNSSVDLPGEMVVDKQAQKDQAPVPENKKFKTPLNSNDKIYQDIRDLNFSSISSILNQKAKIIDEYYKERHKAKTVSQIKDFMKKLGSFQTEHQFLRIHTNIVEAILVVTKDPEFHIRLAAEQNLLADADVNMSLDYIEECIAKQEPLLKVLRLLCLASVTGNGLKDKIHANFERELLQTYGYQHRFTLENLTKLGLFKRQEGRTNPFARTRKDFQLVVDVDEHNPTDIAYVYSGYAPLSVRLVEHACRAMDQWKPDSPSADQSNQIRPGWQAPPASEDALKALPGGPAFHAKQSTKVNLDPDGGDKKNQQKISLVVFVGGACFTEVSAIRSKFKTGADREFVVATTKLTNGNALIESILEDLTAYVRQQPQQPQQPQ